MAVAHLLEPFACEWQLSVWPLFGPLQSRLLEFPCGLIQCALLFHLGILSIAAVQHREEREVPQATGRCCGLNSRPFSTTSTIASAARVDRKKPIENGSSVPSKLCPIAMPTTIPISVVIEP
jgi:hypothetical protein